MVLTVTINPLLEKRFYFEEVKQGNVNRSQFEEFKSGGKGINVSRQLNKLRINNMALTFLGGNNGKVLRSVMNSESINYTAVSTKTETRSASIIVESKKSRVTSYFGLNPEVAENEVNEFIDKMRKMITNCSIVIFAGSSPCETANEIFPAGIEFANKEDKISILDTYGGHLQNCLKKIPFAVHNNTDEIRTSLNIKLDSEEAMIEYLNSLYNSGIKLSFLTDGRKPAYLSKFDFHYKILPPKIEVKDSTGSGDAFVAGIAHGLENNLVFEDMVLNAASLGAANAAELEVCNLSKEEGLKFKDHLKLLPVGKKMKLIDDSPNY